MKSVIWLGVLALAFDDLECLSKSNSFTELDQLVHEYLSDEKAE